MSGDLAKLFRSEADKNFQLAQAQMESAQFEDSARLQVLATVGHMKSALYDALARVEEERPGDPTSQMFERSIAVANQMQAVRMAAAQALNSGDYSEFDKLVADGILGGPGSTDGGADSKSGATG